MTGGFIIIYIKMTWGFIFQGIHYYILYRLTLLPKIHEFLTWVYDYMYTGLVEVERLRTIQSNNSRYSVTLYK